MLARGEIKKEEFHDTGSGKEIFSKTIWFEASQSVSPVKESFRPKTAPISPALVIGGAFFVSRSSSILRFSIILAILGYRNKLLYERRNGLCSRNR
jgi:hypothetical protein